MKSYLLAYFSAMLIALVTMPTVIRLAVRFGLVDKPHARKIHATPVPRVGGIGVFFAAACVVLMTLWLGRTLGGRFADAGIPIITLICASAVIFLTGLLDDVKNLSGQIKFAILIAASAAICRSGATIDTLTIGNHTLLDFGPMSWPITIVWIVGITVGVNFIDGVDGLAAGLSGIVCAVIAIVAASLGQPFIALIMVAILGSLCGFLFFNFNPAKTFMGDGGSMFLGFTIGAGTVVCASQANSIRGLALPALALGVPIVDSACTMIRRGILERRSIFKAERGHIHHRLLDLGLSQKQVVVVLYAVTLIASAMGSVMLITPGPTSAIVFVCTYTLHILFFHIVGSVRLKETVEAIRSHMESKKQLGKYKESFEDIQLHIRVATSFEKWFEALCQGAEHMGFAWISVDFRAAGGDTHTSVWRPAEAEAVDLSNLTIVKIPLPQINPSLSVGLEIAIPIDGTLESAGHRAMLFGRLLDETDMTELLQADGSASTFSTKIASGD